ncbi:MAG: FAD-dependent oxidoreductase [Thermoanaerobaculia bacterium]|nr:FAD-dependent oxidoreductase [Thermoanaerobaculia bacterium]
MTQELRPDVLLIGGGVAGLVCLDRLVTAGFEALLVERRALGIGQTAHTQGILHSGLKYLLHGPLDGPMAEEFRVAASRWRSDLQEGLEMDLRGCRLHSDRVLVWSSGPFSPELLERFAADGRPKRVEAPPSFLAGEVFEFPEPVIDAFSLLALLRDRHRTRIFVGEVEPASTTDDSVCVGVAGHRVEPRRLLLTAGAGNQALGQKLGLAVSMRRLPLHMVVVRSAELPPFWGHGVVGEGSPELTVTYHGKHRGEGMWYLGGRLSEEGVERTEEEQIDAAKATLARMLPNIGIGGARFDTLRVDRAEPVRPDGRRFEIEVEGESPVWACWPVKLVLAPRLADRVLKRLEEEGIEPSSEPAAQVSTSTVNREVEIAEAPWAT